MRIISTITEIDLDLTPQDIAYQLRGSDYLCFLDSSLMHDKYSRFSYIGFKVGGNNFFNPTDSGVFENFLVIESHS